MEGSKGGLHIVLRDKDGKIKEDYKCMRTPQGVIKEKTKEGIKHEITW
jgi:hypothetical protein